MVRQRFGRAESVETDGHSPFLPTKGLTRGGSSKESVDPEPVLT